jgi:hypothetical protein
MDAFCVKLQWLLIEDLAENPSINVVTFRLDKLIGKRNQGIK